MRCSACKKEIDVVFYDEKGRPLCKTCYEKRLKRITHYDRKRRNRALRNNQYRTDVYRPRANEGNKQLTELSGMYREKEDEYK